MSKTSGPGSIGCATINKKPWGTTCLMGGKAGNSIVALLAFCLAFEGPGVFAVAGGGPENLFLVVNQNSDASKQIANHYLRWRGVPASNVLYVDWDSGTDRVSSATFREKLLQPILAAIQSRGLRKQIDIVAYSCDFPWRVNFTADFAGQELPPANRPWLAVTGATFLWRDAMAKNPRLLSPVSNAYVPKAASFSTPDGKKVSQTTSQAFHGTDRWTSGGKKAAKGGQTYWLSTMLACTEAGGTTPDEALRYLRHSAQADGRRPIGTFYFMQNRDIRSRVRHGQFAEAVKQLRFLGVKAEIMMGKLPLGRQDVLGIMTGTARFDLENANVTLLPGAICDHFTSYGGFMSGTTKQTPLSEFLRHGAAGASGTVVEPLAIQQKFPTPLLHVHYARGCSLAEAFYQSVSAPFQLLIVGDPLCQPWARSPFVTVNGVAAGDTVQGEIELTPTAQSPRKAPVRRFRLFVDGRLWEEHAAGKPFSLDTTALADGHHELRIVALGPTTVECQGRKIVSIQVNNHGQTIEFTVEPYGRVPAGQNLTLSSRAEGAAGILFLQNRRVLGRVTGEKGTLVIQARELGAGPVTLSAIAMGTHSVAAKPITLQVHPVPKVPEPTHQ